MLTRMISLAFSAIDRLPCERKKDAGDTSQAHARATRKQPAKCSTNGCKTAGFKSRKSMTYEDAPECPKSAPRAVKKLTSAAGMAPAAAAGAYHLRGSEQVSGGSASRP